MSPTDPNLPKKELVLSYLQLRRFIGLLGISLPFTLALGTFIINFLLRDGHEQAIQPTISHYYFSIMHVEFVGVLCLLSGFLFCYPGPHRHDKLISNLAGFFALGVAAFPTNCQGFICDNAQYINLKWWDTWVNWVHYGSAALLFICFAFFCFVIFQDDDSGRAKEDFDDKKKRRNRFYNACGVIILASIMMIGALSLYECYVNKLPCFISTYNTIFFETIALLAFGSSWLLKGTYELTEIPKLFEPLVKHYR